MCANHDEDVLEMRAHAARREGQRSRLLEHERHDVVSDVALPQQLHEQRHATIRQTVMKPGAAEKMGTGGLLHKESVESMKTMENIVHV